MNESIEFHANGKLLITGEYLVLVGARALALPVRFGQKMMIRESKTGIIEWESCGPGGTWFTAQLESGALHIISSGNSKVAARLKKLLSSAQKLNQLFLSDSGGYKVIVTANFALEWGLGSSSTLCSLVADWAGVDAFQLFRMISNGSGYDIACARPKDMIYYSLIGFPAPAGSTTPSGLTPAITPSQAGSALRNHSYFVYLGNKQDSNREVSAFLAGKRYSATDLERVSGLASLICEAVSHDELIGLVNEHEAIIAKILDRQVIAARFPAFPGTVKSLGAWGGDFAMFVSGKEPGEVLNTLRQYGFSKIFRFSEIEATS